LDDDGSVDVGKDAEGEHPQGGETTTGEDVEEAKQLAALLQEALEGCLVDAWHRHVDAQPHHEQQAQGGEDPVPQAFGLQHLADDFSGAWVAPPADDHGGTGWEERNGKSRPPASGRGERLRT